MEYLIYKVKKFFSWFVYTKPKEHLLPLDHKVKHEIYFVDHKYEWIYIILRFINVLFIFIIGIIEINLTTILIYYVLMGLIYALTDYNHNRELIPFNNILSMYNEYNGTWSFEYCHKTLQSEAVIPADDDLGILFIYSDDFQKMHENNTFNEYLKKIKNTADFERGFFLAPYDFNVYVAYGYYTKIKPFNTYHAELTKIEIFTEAHQNLKFLHITNKEDLLFVGYAKNDRKGMTVKQLCDEAYANMLADKNKYLEEIKINPYSTSRFVYRLIQQKTQIPQNQLNAIIFVAPKYMDKLHSLNKYNGLHELLIKAVSGEYNCYWDEYNEKELVFYFNDIETDNLKKVLQKLVDIKLTDDDYSVIIGCSASNGKQMTLQNLYHKAYDNLKQNIGNPEVCKVDIEPVVKTHNPNKIRKFNYTFLQSNTIIQFNRLPAIIFVQSEDLIASNNHDNYLDLFKVLVGAISGFYECSCDEYNKDTVVFYIENIQPEMFDNIIQKLNDVEPIDKNSTINIGYARYNDGYMTLMQLYLQAYKNLTTNA